MRRIILLFMSSVYSFASAQLTVVQTTIYGDKMKILGEIGNTIYGIGISDLETSAGLVDQTSMLPIKIKQPKHNFSVYKDGKRVSYTIKDALIYNNKWYGIYLEYDYSINSIGDEHPVKMVLVDLETFNETNVTYTVLEERSIFRGEMSRWESFYDKINADLYFTWVKSDGVHIYTFNLREMTLTRDDLCDFGSNKSFNPRNISTVLIPTIDTDGDLMMTVSYLDFQNYEFGSGSFFANREESFSNKSMISDFIGSENLKYLGKIQDTKYYLDFRFKYGNDFLKPSAEAYCPTISGFSLIGNHGSTNNISELPLGENQLSQIFKFRENEFEVTRQDTILGKQIIHNAYINENGDLEILFELYSDLTESQYHQNSGWYGGGSIPLSGFVKPMFEATASKGLFLCRFSMNGHLKDFVIIPREIKDSRSFYVAHNNQHFFFYNKTRRNEKGKLESGSPELAITKLDKDWKSEEVQYNTTHINKESEKANLYAGPEFGYVSQDGKSVYFIGEYQISSTKKKKCWMKYELN